VTHNQEVLSQQKPEPVSAAAKSESLFSIWFFSSQGGPSQKIKICPELSGNKLSEYVFNNSVHCLWPERQGKMSGNINFRER
jgi:hypothetical protein